MLSHVRYGIDHKPGRYSRSAHFWCDWFLDNKNSVIGELCACRVGYHIGVFLRFLNRARWRSFAFCWSKNAIEKNMHKKLGLTKYMDILTQLTCRIAINKKLLSWWFWTEKLVAILNLNAWWPSWKKIKNKKAFILFNWCFFFIWP